MGSVRTSILGRPRPLPGHRRADQTYTFICDEPDMGWGAVHARRWRATGGGIVLDRGSARDHVRATLGQRLEVIHFIGHRRVDLAEQQPYAIEVPVEAGHGLGD